AGCSKRFALPAHRATLRGRMVPQATVAGDGAASVTTSRTSWIRVLWAGLLSLVMPGLGQVYAQRYRAALWFAATAFAIAGAFIALEFVFQTSLALLALVIAFALASVVVHVSAAVHAGFAKRRTAVAQRPGWRRSTWTWGAVLLAAS